MSRCGANRPVSFPRGEAVHQPHSGTQDITWERMSQLGQWSASMRPDVEEILFQTELQGEHHLSHPLLSSPTCWHRVSRPPRPSALKPGLHGSIPGAQAAGFVLPSAAVAHDGCEGAARLRGQPERRAEGGGDMSTGDKRLTVGSCGTFKGMSH